MSAYVALLRAVNVGGTGKLPMEELRAMCAALSFENPRTYIASGNVVFEAPAPEAEVKAALEAKLAAYAGKPVGVMVRTDAEIAAVLAANPFTAHPGNRVMAVFLDAPPPADLGIANLGADEEVKPGKREIYARYGDGMGQSKLRIAAARTGTARNMNTVAKLAEMAAGR